MRFEVLVSEFASSTMEVSETFLVVLKKIDVFITLDNHCEEVLKILSEPPEENCWQRFWQVILNGSEPPSSFHIWAAVENLKDTENI